MATSVVSSTIVDPSGTPVPDIEVIARLQPGPGFRNSDKSEIAESARDTTDAAGDWSLALERNADILPAGTWYEIEERLTDGSRIYAIVVGPTNVELKDAVVTLLPAPVAVGLLTRAEADALYQRAGAQSTVGVVEIDMWSASA